MDKRPPQSAQHFWSPRAAQPSAQPPGLFRIVLSSLLPVPPPPAGSPSPFSRDTEFPQSSCPLQKPPASPHGAHSNALGHASTAKFHRYRISRHRHHEPSIRYLVHSPFANSHPSSLASIPLVDAVHIGIVVLIRVPRRKRRIAEQRLSFSPHPKRKARLPQGYVQCRPSQEMDLPRWQR